MSKILLTVTLLGITLEQLEAALGGMIQGDPVVRYLWDNGSVLPFPEDSLRDGEVIFPVSIESNSGWDSESPFWLAFPKVLWESVVGDVPESTWGHFQEEEWADYKGVGIHLWDDEKGWTPL